MRKKILIVIALIAFLATEVSWAKQQSENPPPSEKPPVSNNPTDCTGKGGHTWCRSGKDDKEITQARSAQIPRSGGSGIRFGGVRGENLKHSSLKSSGDSK